MPKILITGGARSGKSSYALELAKKFGEPVLFVATAEPIDFEMAKRIERHRKTRPKGWVTLEARRHIGSVIEKKIGKSKVVLVDCITLLIGNVFNEFKDNPDDKLDESTIEKKAMQEVKGLINCMGKNKVSFILVTNEVGEGIVPENKLGRLYRDILGKTNQMLARECDEVYLMVSGIPVKLKPDR